MREFRFATIALLALGVLLGLPLDGQAANLGNVNAGLQTPASTDVLEQGRQEKRQDLLKPTEAKPQLNIRASKGGVYLQGERFRADEIHVEGNTLLPQETLQLLVQPYVGKDVTLEELNTLVEAINNHYRVEGYLTSLAYIPPQDISGGRITIQVMEGRIGEISIAGNKYFQTGVIARQFGERPGEPFNGADLEDALLRMNRTQPYRVKATLSPGAHTGETDIRLKIEERQPWDVNLSLDNQGRPFIGTMHWGQEVTNHNLTGVGDRLSMQLMDAVGTRVAMASYSRPLNRFGTEIGINASYSKVNVDLELPNQPSITGQAYNYGLLLSQPLDRNRTWVADAGLNIRRTNSYFEEFLDSRDDIRSLQVGLSFQKGDRLGYTSARVQNTFAPEWGGSARFWKAETFLNRVFALPRENYLILKSYAQMTPDALPGAEQFQLGGAHSVRGYTEGLLLGDRGYQFSLEHRFPIPGLKRVSPWLGERLQGSTFFDFGQTWLDSSNPFWLGGFSNKANRTTLAGAGVGVRAQLTQYLQGFVDLGFGLLNRGSGENAVEPNAQPSARVHFGIRSALMPQDYRMRGETVTRVEYDGNRLRLTPLKPYRAFMPVVENIRLENIHLKVREPEPSPPKANLAKS